MECCVNVSTEIVLQIDKLYTVLRILELMFSKKDYSPKLQFQTSSHQGQCTTYQIIKAISTTEFHNWTCHPSPVFKNPFDTAAFNFDKGL